MEQDTNAQEALGSDIQKSTGRKGSNTLNILDMLYHLRNYMASRHAQYICIIQGAATNPVTKSFKGRETVMAHNLHGDIGDLFVDEGEEQKDIAEANMSEMEMEMEQMRQSATITVETVGEGEEQNDITEANMTEMAHTEKTQETSKSDKTSPSHESTRGDVTTWEDIDMDQSFWQDMEKIPRVINPRTGKVEFPIGVSFQTVAEVGPKPRCRGCLELMERGINVIMVNSHNYIYQHMDRRYFHIRQRCLEPRLTTDEKTALVQLMKATKELAKAVPL
jgi:hypothetical protein